MNAIQKEALYNEALSQAQQVLRDESRDIVKMTTISCILSHLFSHFFWTGFYVVDDKKQDELFVGPYQGTMGCLRIHFSRGVCGTCATDKKTIIVSDTHAFPGHIACDSRSKSEIVVPIFNKEKKLIAVLDIDAAEKSMFDALDKKYLEKIACIFQE